tara:strand:+ start:1713 stop:3131 length:1419 start_codon:yes stop_codon:yes gene_type:complete
MASKPIANDPAPVIPFNIDAEQAILGAMIENNRCVDTISDILEARDFYLPIHQRIFEATLALTGEGKEANPVTLGILFEGDEDFQEMGGRKWLVKMALGPVAMVGYRDIAEQVAEIAARRRLIEQLEGVAGIARSDPEKPLAELVDESDAALVAAVERRDTWSQPTIGKCATGVLDRIDRIQKGEEDIGYLTGIAEFDQLTGGLQPGNLVIVGARPSMGKTAVACSAALGLARSNIGVLFVSLEMRGDELAQRMMADICFDGRHGVPYQAIREANVNIEQRRRIMAASETMERWPLHIADPGSCTASRLSLAIRRTKRRMKAMGQDLKVVIVDYLQLLHADQKTRSLVEAVSEVSRTLKAAAKDQEVCILALAQLNRGVEQREDKRPMLSDLRESGQIEQDADTVLFLFREAYYLEKQNPRSPDRQAALEQELDQCRHEIEFICAKRRNGRTGTGKARFFGAFQAVRSGDDR